MSGDYTKGPWPGPVDDGNESTIHLPAAYVSCGGSRFRREANARLVSAAPDLLEACVEAEALLRSLEGLSRNNAEQLAHEVGEIVRAAIAKAEGVRL